MIDRKQRRLRVLSRLREMKVEQARADHVAALAELEEKRELADDTQRRIVALDEWADSLLTVSAPLNPELMRQAQLFRGAEKQTLENQRAEQEQSRVQTEVMRDELRQKFEELSAIERLRARHERFVNHGNLRQGYVELDEAGTQRKNQETKE
jgi:hypothetical protein